MYLKKILFVESWGNFFFSIDFRRGVIPDPKASEALNEVSKFVLAAGKKNLGRSTFKVLLHQTFASLRAL